MRQKIKNILQYSFFLGLGIFLVWWQLKSMSPTEREEGKQAFLNAHYWVVIPIVIMALLAHYSRALRWKIIMKPLGYEPEIKNAYGSTLIGYLGNAAVPRLGEVLRCTFLAKYENLKVDKLFGTIIVERIVDLVCFIVFIAFTVLIQMDRVGAFVKEKFSSIGQNAGMPIWLKIILFVFAVIVFFYVLHFLRKKFPENKVVKKVNDFFNGVLSGLGSIKKIKQKKQFAAHTIFIWSMYLLQIYLGFYAMEGTAHLGFKAACSVLALATLAMIATPGGLGTFPFFVMQTLSMYAVPATTALSFGWLIWVVNTGIVIVAGLLVIILLPLLNKDKLPRAKQEAKVNIRNI